LREMQPGLHLWEFLTSRKEIASNAAIICLSTWGVA
jgi:hypothetical protein